MLADDKHQTSVTSACWHCHYVSFAQCRKPGISTLEGKKEETVKVK